MRYLYHYTSLETLALILRNKTICFNNLLNVDDIEEAETEDMGKFGKFIYTSCWTEDAEESIPLWNLYTPNMHGVRIGLPEFPFKKYYFKKGEFLFSQDIDTYINFKEIYDENKVSIVATEPRLVKVEYTNALDKLFSKVKTESFEGALREYLQAKSLSDINSINISVSYSLKELGVYKREHWKFQKEWRYIISVSPLGLQDNNPPTFIKQQELIRRLEDKNLEPPYRQIFLEIDDSALDSMEVIMGPKMNDAEKILTKALLEKFCPKCIYRESSLRIR